MSHYVEGKSSLLWHVSHFVEDKSSFTVAYECHIIWKESLIYYGMWVSHVELKSGLP